MTKDITPDASTDLAIGSPTTTSKIHEDKTRHEIGPTLTSEDQQRSFTEHDKKLSNMGSSDVAVSCLTQGILSLYASDCQKIQQNLKELVQSQSILLETVQQENSRFVEMKNQFSLDDIFVRSKQYHAKLVQIKKEMASLTEKAAKLKKRSLRLQEQKQREALQKEQSREREIEKEKQLLAKVVPKP